MPSTGTSSPTAGTGPSSAVADVIRLDQVSFGYGSQLVVREVSVSVPAGAFVTILGPSGCGKTTLLRLIGGYLQPTAGRVWLQGRDVSGSAPQGRRVGMVFQSYALFPHLTARQNVAFGLEVRRQPTATLGAIVETTLDRVGLSAAERDRYPSQLSGGQQQRVALARALAIEPPVLLLDEPLASLDRHLRVQVRAELARIHRLSGVTTVMVTHDQEEALASSDLVAVMEAGRLLQVGPPRDVYDRPLTEFVARFVGDANLIAGRHLGLRPQSTYLMRPERIRLGTEWPGKVTSITYHGTNLVAEIVCQEFTLKWRTWPDLQLAVGDTVTVDLPADSLWEIPGEGPAQ